MSVVALITKSEEIPTVITWARQFAVAREANLIVLCWIESLVNIQSESNIKNQEDATKLIVEAENYVKSFSSEDTAKSPLEMNGRIEVRKLVHTDYIKATIAELNRVDAELLVTAAQDHSGATGATYESNRLLKQSPCNTIVLFGESPQKTANPRVLVGVTDNAHDSSAVSLAARLSEKTTARVTIARAETDYEGEGLEVGQRELRQILRDAGVGRNDKIQRQVLQSGDIEEISSIMDKNDLVLVGANDQTLAQRLVDLTDNPIIGVIKRSPPLRPWHFGRKQGQWVPRISPADYADLIQNLRTGSKLNIDFLTMLGLAAAIASFGLLKDSAVVVIGSMLLAPLMTPMLGAGLALAQANPKLGKLSMLSIGVGFVFTLVISFIIGVVTPGDELTPQIVSRGGPDLLDLGIALLSAGAAAYALARPNLVGSVAGVAIATALVPPLCSVGLSLSYHNYLIAQGAALLFITNVVAIILGAAATFRMLGVTAKITHTSQQSWVYRAVALLTVIMFILAIPLEQALEQNIDQGTPQPRMYPLTKNVEQAIAEHVAKDEDVEIVATGRPSSIHTKNDVVIVLTSPYALSRDYGKELTKIVRDKMKNDKLKVAVFCLLDAWEEDLKKHGLFNDSWFYDSKKMELME